MNRVDKAKKYFQLHYNCAQSVLLAFAPDYELPKAKASKIAQAFGGGLARQGEICGAVTGALMVIGLKYGKIKPEEEEAREKTYSLAQKFFSFFKEKHGALSCRQLLGIDLSQPGGYELASSQGLFMSVCPSLIASAVTILEEIL
ncbi:MAG: C-GCAxxG-C-C family protein [Candidatus Aminicenantes bacterium]|nr:C-GCAxxG-C-C family protein [Candidatus Aminicenantes bacterium]